MTSNPLTFRVESSLGAVYISLLSLFFIGLIFIAVKNLEADVDIMTITTENSKIKTISKGEVNLIQEWIIKNNIELEEGQGYRYLVRKYPSRPWFN
jgi:hypothetical protein